MGNKYTVEAGTGHTTVIYKGTEWLIIALVHLWLLDLSDKDIFWKKITVRQIK